MKELSIEEKAKAYDEALERAKECHIDGLSLHQPVKDVIEHIFPELEESEDEKIRKALIDFFQDWHKTKPSRWSIPVSDVIAWLEKQGDTWKPSDEQMNLLEVLVEDNSQMYFFTTLESLYKQLKKLKGD